MPAIVPGALAQCLCAQQHNPPLPVICLLATMARLKRATLCDADRWAGPSLHMPWSGCQLEVITSACWQQQLPTHASARRSSPPEVRARQLEMLEMRCPCKRTT